MEVFRHVKNKIGCAQEETVCTKFRQNMPKGTGVYSCYEMTALRCDEKPAVKQGRETR